MDVSTNRHLIVVSVDLSTYSSEEDLVSFYQQVSNVAEGLLAKQQNLRAANVYRPGYDSMREKMNDNTNQNIMLVFVVEDATDQARKESMEEIVSTLVTETLNTLVTSKGFPYIWVSMPLTEANALQFEPSSVITLSGAAGGTGGRTDSIA